VCLAGHEAKRKDGLEIQLNIDQNEKPKDKLAADHFFSSLQLLKNSSPFLLAPKSCALSTFDRDPNVSTAC